MKEFEIWMEGYAMNGQMSVASFIGKAKGETFNDACRNFKYEKGEKLNLDKHYEHQKHLSIWGCRLFDNEADARKSFG